MNGSKQASICALAGLLVLGCGGKDEKPEDAPSGERTKEPTPETPKDAPKGPFAAFDFEAAEASWQGSWVLEGEVAGKPVAWMIDGALLVESDGAKERKLEFSLYSPCQVAYTDTEAGVTVYKSFVFVRDALHAGLGSAGTVAGDSVIACTGGKTYVLTGDECLAWSEMFDNWKSEPANCAIEGEGDARAFVIDGKTKIPFVDDMSLATAQLQGKVAVKHANFEAAKAALASTGDPAP
ncbi:hypothetical protein ENSA5_40850 [Enhygromyxa salina]|uniref:Lipoprotein n=1 Tax=Enhygromyxa salina TaxID=215803 RepID=A0A2S9XNM4_9BACT|nr:hypothetical protein [Enhygromyxa salina]PRP94466.1 hypothetical protein ENSA5_40850 [Enhygromyxa salina]